MQKMTDSMDYDMKLDAISHPASSFTVQLDEQ